MELGYIALGLLVVLGMGVLILGRLFALESRITVIDTLLNRREVWRLRKMVYKPNKKEDPVEQIKRKPGRPPKEKP